MRGSAYAYGSITDRRVKARRLQAELDMREEWESLKREE